MSAKPPLDKAAENNKRLLHYHAKVISQGDPATYVTSVHKVAHWLNNERAYYPDARPEILKLLLVASLALRRSLGVDEDVHVPFDQSAFADNPMVHAYNTLTRTVEPFLNLFEDGLRGQFLRHIPSLDSRILITNKAPLENFLIGNSSGSAGPPPLPSSGIQASSNTVSSPSFEVNMDKEHNVKMDPEGIIQTLQGTPHSASQPPPVGAPPSKPGAADKSATPTVPIGKTKVKKKKNIDFNLLVQHDIKGLLEKKKGHATAVLDMESSGKASSTLMMPTPSETRSQDAGVASKPEIIDQKVVSIVKENVAPQEEIRITRIPEKNVLSEVPADQPITELLENISISEIKEHIQGVENFLQPVLVAQSTPDIPPRGGEAQVSAVGQPVADEEREPYTGQASRTELPPQGEDLTTAPLLPTNVAPADEPMDESGFLPDTRQPTAMELDSTPERVVHTSPSEQSNTKVISPDRPLRDPVLSQTELDLDYTKGIFGTEMRVVARQQGLKKSSRISVQFEIPEIQYQSVLSWLNASENIASSICFTLGCYPTADLVESAKRTGCTTFEAQVSSTRSIWPEYGGLMMNANFKGSRGDFPLSPPLQVTPENLVDVSPFLVMGNNVIELIQRRDLSLYTFVLHAHFPTKAQLHQVEVRKQRDKEWRGKLDHHSRPLKIVLKTFDTGAF